MSKYTDQNNVVNYIKRELTDAEVNILPVIISQVSLFIDNYTTRSWKDIDAETDTALSERYFDGSGTKEIDVDNFRDLDTISLLDSSGSAIETYTSADLSNVIQYPLNSEAKTSIYLVDGRFSTAPKSVKVKAKFDSGDIPDDVKYVATAMVSKLLAKMGDDMRGNVKGKKLGDFTVSYGDVKGVSEQMDTEVSALDQYKSIEI